MYILSLVYWQLLLYGVHVGHSFANSIVFSGWLVYTFRQIILIINLFKTTLSFKNGYISINHAIGLSGPVWFINLHRSVELYVNYFAKLCGEFCYSTYWINGLISNWISLANTFMKLFRRVSGSHKGKFAKLELDSSPWFMGRWTWPRVALVSSVSTSPHPTKECSYLGIPCIGIVDTDISGHIANIATPGNDDSLDCIVLYNTHISQYILEKKYGVVSGWFMRIRKVKRLIKFKEWVFLHYLNRYGKVNLKKVSQRKNYLYDIKKSIQEDLKFKFNINNLFYGLRFYFAKNSGLNVSKEQVDLYEPDNIKISSSYLKRLMYFYRKGFIFLSKTLNYYFIKCSWMLYKYIKKYNLSNKNFNLKFLTGIYHKKYFKKKMYMNFFITRFLKNRFYKTFLKRNWYRFNLFVLKFVKFFYIKKYDYYRSGLVDAYSSNFLKVSSFSYVAMSYCSFLFIDNFISPVIRYSNNLSTFLKLKKCNYFVKWHFFKEGINTFLKSLINNNKINKYLKFLLSYKSSIILQKVIQINLKKLHTYIYFYFKFFYWDNFKFKKLNISRKSVIFKSWYFLKNMQKNMIYLNLLKNSLFSFNKFKFLFQNNKINKINLNKINLNKNRILVYFILFCKYYKKKMNFNSIYEHIYSYNMKRLKRQFFIVRKNNLRFKKSNKVIYRLEHEFGKFKHLKNREQDKYLKKYYTNKYFKFIKYPNKNFSSFKYFRWFFKKTKYIKKLKNYYITKRLFNNFFFSNNNNYNNIYYNYIFIDVENKNFINYIKLFNFYTENLLYKNLITNFVLLNIFNTYYGKILNYYNLNLKKLIYFFRRKFIYKNKITILTNNRIKFYRNFFNKKINIKKNKYWIFNVTNAYYPIYFYIYYKLNICKLLKLVNLIFSGVKRKYILKKKNKYNKVYNQKINIYLFFLRYYNFYNKYLSLYYKKGLLSH